jgi:hypothetical protein
LEPFKVRVPLVIVRLLMNVAPPVTVNGPPAKAMLALLIKLAMVWFSAALIDPIVIVALAKVGPIQTESVVAGTLPRSQLPAVVH